MNIAGILATIGYWSPAILADVFFGWLLIRFIVTPYIRKIVRQEMGK